MVMIPLRCPSVIIYGIPNTDLTQPDQEVLEPMVVVVTNWPLCTGQVLHPASPQYRALRQRHG